MKFLKKAWIVSIVLFTIYFVKEYFEKGFIRAECIAFDDYVTLGGEAGAKDAGRWRLEGKEYVLSDGDVLHFRFNV